MDILPASIVSLGKLHLSPLNENSGSGAVYACLGTVSRIGGWGYMPGWSSAGQSRRGRLVTVASVHVRNNMQLGRERWGFD